MSRHADAIGYLNDLALSVGEPWFTLICDLAARSGITHLDPSTLDTLLAISVGQASCLRTRQAASMTTAATTPAMADFLEALSGFSNFKLLDETLEVEFTKRITVIFGSNGSGKSSLCKALKLLANTEPPTKPLQNVRAAGPVASASTFNYKFRSDAVAQNWSQNVGYGLRSRTIKYFDAGIALRNVKNAVEPGRIIELSPFKLHIFQTAKELTTEFRSYLQQIQQSNAAKIKQTIENIRELFVKFENSPLMLLGERTLSGLQAEIKAGEAFNQHALLKETQEAAAELEKATSEEGLKLLKAEHRDLEAFLSSITALIDATESIWGINPARRSAELAAKQAAQELLAKSLIPEDKTLESFTELLRATSSLCNLEAPGGQICPLCKRNLGESEVELFKRYHGLLTGELEKSISSLRQDIEKAKLLVETVKAINRKEWAKFSTLATELLDAANAASDIVISSCHIDKEPTEEARGALAALKALSNEQHLLLQQKAKTIKVASTGRDALKKQLEALKKEIAPLEYANTVNENLGILKYLHRLAEADKYWRGRLSSLTPLLKKITEAAKDAHDDLVVSDFEARLNIEYKALTEKQMEDFGVKLAQKGSDAAVTLMPHVGGKEMESVLSEGEQRVHALALFFAELETCPQSVLVFDDPISSFDYNYIANYCARLRDFSLAHPTHQIIVLTHNWEFFVQLQTSLNGGGLNGQLSVQVLENCAVVADYSEKATELKTDIAAMLAMPGEPTKAQKEEMAGKLRRLIEAVVNTHVFNQQRHQYKQKSQPISEFHEFTKIVPLLSTEAITLRDLYAKLSITEHDDPRNAYVNTDKATFQARYDSIAAIEAAVIARK